MGLAPINQTKKCRRCSSYNTAKQEGGEHHPEMINNNREWTEYLCFDCHRHLHDNPLELKDFAEQYEKKWEELFPEAY